MLLIGAMLAMPLAQAQVTIERPWVRATAPGAPVGGGYMTIRNAGAVADRLVGATSPGAARVELHVHIKEGEVMKMRLVSAFEVPANGSFELKPGGPHLMFMQLHTPFREGERVPVQLKFEKAGTLGVEFHVGRLGESAHGDHRKH